MPVRTKTKSPLQGVEWPVEPFFKATVPLSPSVNGSYKTNSSAQFFASDALKQFKDAAYFALCSSTDVKYWHIIEVIRTSKVKIPLILEMNFYFKTMWLRDLSGPVKATEDVLFDYIELNDRLVSEIHLKKFADRENPRCEISLSVCTERISG